MSSHQRRIFKRFQLRVKLLAIFAFVRRQAMAILKRRKQTAQQPTVAQMLSRGVDARLGKVAA